MSNKETNLSIMFLGSGFVIFIMAMIKSLGYLLVSLFAMPYMDEEMSAAFETTMGDISTYLNTGSPTFDFVLIGVLLFCPIVAFTMRFVSSLVIGKRTGNYEFEIPDGMSVAGFFISAIFYPVTVFVTYMCTTVHYITIDMLQEYLSTASELLTIPVIMDIIAVTVFIGVIIAMFVISLVHKERKSLVPITEEDIF